MEHRILLLKMRAEDGGNGICVKQRCDAAVNTALICRDGMIEKGRDDDRMVGIEAVASTLQHDGNIAFQYGDHFVLRVTMIFPYDRSIIPAFLVFYEKFSCLKITAHVLPPCSFSCVGWWMLSLYHILARKARFVAIIIIYITFDLLYN